MADDRRQIKDQDSSSIGRSLSAGYELLEHPADVKLRVWGATLEELFANAAAAMMAFLFGDHIANARAEGTEQFDIRARDREALLVDFLSELLYRVSSEYRAYVDVRVREVSEGRIIAMAGIVAACACDDIKAVTHHELAVRKGDGGWEATVVFDV